MLLCDCHTRSLHIVPGDGSLKVKAVKGRASSPFLPPTVPAGPAGQLVLLEGGEHAQAVLRPEDESGKQ